MQLNEIAEEVVEELKGTYEYNDLGAIAYYQTVYDMADYLLEKWDVAVFVAIEDAIETELRRKGHVPTD